MEKPNPTVRCRLEMDKTEEREEGRDVEREETDGMAPKKFASAIWSPPPPSHLGRGLADPWLR